MILSMGISLKIFLFILGVIFILSCSPPSKGTLAKTDKTAAEILGNPDYLAICYGGYRENTRDIQPTIEQLKQDLLLMSAMKIRLLRTYNVKLAHASNVLAAIKELKDQNPGFEMYVMLGAWIDCQGAWTDQPDHETEDAIANETEIRRAVELANQYPDIVKIIAVGNEAMIKWAASYYVQPGVILKWVNYLQDLKSQGVLNQDIWITSSDNFASWGGGDKEYHVEDLNQLIKAVDFISMHTYPMHDTHYNPVFWGIAEEESQLPKTEQIKAAMLRARDYAIDQYQSVLDYMISLGVKKPIHIGETGWASYSNELYGNTGSRATDEYKAGIYYNLMREWTNDSGLSLFYFEAFDEPWKDALNPEGSENHFGLFTVDGRAKYAIWNLVDQQLFDGLNRGSGSITKTYDGDMASLLEEIVTPPLMESIMAE